MTPDTSQTGQKRRVWTLRTYIKQLCESVHVAARVLNMQTLADVADRHQKRT